MKTTARVMSLFLFSFLLISCGKKAEQKIVEITAKDFQFVAPDSIPSGWAALRFINTGHTEHFFLLNKVPDSIPFDLYKTAIAEQFDIVFDSLKAGKSKEDAIGMLISQIPSWYFTDVKQMGGCGIVSMGKAVDVTLNLPTGRYIMECYIKEQGVFHTKLGMIKELFVTNETSEIKPPLFNMELTLTNDAIKTSGAVNKGSNTFAVRYAEQPEAGLGNDVHIIKLNDSTDLAKAIEWMDWMNITGLQSPSPVLFLGGVQEMPVGNTSYFTAVLEPGRYAFIAETGAVRGLVSEFSVE